ncbi:MAG: hypothetical protein KGR26_02000 [Cyanobacteria bacterium REEB65]|nr:hypothetical protein [Cyanobacteria bacterium REEB65]
MRREIDIHGTDDLLEARECLRSIARDIGCDLVREAKLVAGLSDLAERFYLRGRSGRLVLSWDGACLEAILEHDPARQPVPAAKLSEGTRDALAAQTESLGGVRFMWDEVLVEASEGTPKVVLRSWPSV